MKRFILKSAQKLILQPLYRQTRGMTLGTRVVVMDDAARVLLVRHTYAPGWLLPGGGVERGETIVDAATREVREEAAIVALEPPSLLGLYLNDRNFPGDHIACFVLRAFRQEAFRPNAEIAAASFFPISTLPEGTTPGTRRRILEAGGGVPVSPAW